LGAWISLKTALGASRGGDELCRDGHRQVILQVNFIFNNTELQSTQVVHGGYFPLPIPNIRPSDRRIADPRIGSPSNRTPASPSGATTESNLVQSYGPQVAEALARSQPGIDLGSRGYSDRGSGIATALQSMKGR
jgi:hypothetical protein